MNIDEISLQSFPFLFLFTFPFVKLRKSSTYNSASLVCRHGYLSHFFFFQFLCVVFFSVCFTFVIFSSVFHSRNLIHICEIINNILGGRLFVPKILLLWCWNSLVLFCVFIREQKCLYFHVESINVDVQNILCISQRMWKRVCECDSEPDSRNDKKEKKKITIFIFLRIREYANTYWISNKRCDFTKTNINIPGYWATCSG